MQEVDLRSLLYGDYFGTLKWGTNNMTSIKKLVEDSSIVYREFNDHYEWTPTKATNYIESVMLNIEMHEIVLFKYNDEFFICNGLNRIKTLREFINNKLKLSAKGLEKYKDLANKKFKDLDENYQYKFLNNIYIRTITYEYKSNPQNRNLTKKEVLEIQKYLYHIYNNCIKLELTEIQKAEYSDEYINCYFKNNLLNKSEFLEKIKSLYFCNSKNKNNEIDSILVNIRSYLSLTYNPINEIKKYKTTKDRIKNLYTKSINNLEPDHVIRDFIIIIDVLYNMQQLKIWKESENLHNRFFIEMLYWLLSIIKKDNLLNIVTFPIESIIKASNDRAELFSKENFTIRGFVNRIEFIKEYAEKYLGLDLKKYIEGTEEMSLKKDKTSYPKQDYSFTPLPSNTMKFSDLLREVKEGNYDLFSKIQRAEVMNIIVASEIIQTILLGLKLPPILIYEKNENGKIIRSVTDGKQRLLALIAFVGETIKKLDGEAYKPKKSNFALKDLKVLTELNGQTFNGLHKTKMLEENLKKKILDYDLAIVVVNEQDNTNFNEKEHFIRLNGSFKKKNSFCIWRSIYDSEVLESIINVAQKHRKKLFCNNINDNNSIVIRLAYLENEFKDKDTLKAKISTSEINSWLLKLEKAKTEYIEKNNNSKVKKLRSEYLNSIKEIDIKISNIENWLNENNLNIYEIFDLKNRKSNPKQFICLYQLLKNISIDTLYIKSDQIIQILKDYFKEIKNKLNQNEINDLLKYYKMKIDILDNNHRIDSNLYIQKMNI